MDRDPVTARHVAEHGWSVLGITPRAGDPGDAFSYTIGLLDSFDHPELLLGGLTGPTGQSVLNAVGELIREGARFCPGDRSEDVLVGFAVEFRLLPVDVFYRDAGSLMRWRSETAFPMLQVVWPDRDGRFPWQGGATPGQLVREDWWWRVAELTGSDEATQLSRGWSGEIRSTLVWGAALSLAATCRLHERPVADELQRSAALRGITPGDNFRLAALEQEQRFAELSPAEAFSAAHEGLPSVIDALPTELEPELDRLLAEHRRMRREGTL